MVIPLLQCVITRGCACFPHATFCVRSRSCRRFQHVDACEAAIDSPLLYEAGWGKNLSYGKSIRILLPLGLHVVTMLRYEYTLCDPLLHGARNWFTVN